MKRITIALACALLFAAGVAVVGCGGEDGGEELTIEEYFDQLGAAYERFSQRSEAVNEEFYDRMVADPSEEIPPEEFESFFRAHLELLQEYLDELDGLSPPGEARDVHEELLDAGRELHDAQEADLQEMVDAEFPTDIGPQLTEEMQDESWTQLGERLARACTALEAIAAEHGIDADLDCEGDWGRRGRINLPLPSAPTAS